MFYESPLKRGNCFYAQALALVGKLREAKVALVQLERNDPHREFERPWYAKYRRRILAVEKGERRAGLRRLR